MADKTTGQLDAVPIGDLPVIDTLYDDTLIPVEQQGQAKHMTGAQWKKYGESAASKYVGQAQEAATQAAQSAEEAAEKVGQIGDAVEQTQANKEAAEAAQAAAEAASQGVKEYADAAAESASQAAQSASGVQQYVSQAQQAAEDAQSAKTAAELAETDAQAAKTSAQLAQTSAEQARDSALTSATTAQESASEAAQSASTAKQYSGNPPKPINGTWWIWNANSGAYEDTGIKSVLSIVKSYPSVAAMEADVGNMHEGDLVIIATEDIGDPDNSKLYVHNGLTWNYLSDLSGVEGVGIANIEQTGGTHAPGTTDTYTITLTDGREFSFTVYNGANGEGTGDMLKSIYDPQNRNTDIFAYVDDAVSGVTITTDTTPTEASTNPVQSGGVYTALSKKQDTLTGTEDQLVGFNAAGEAVAVAAPDPLPTGGATGQVLTKTSSGVAWDDVPSDLPAGGSDGQILTKTADGVAWENPPDTGVTTFNGRRGEVSPSADDYSADLIKFTDGQTFQQKYDAGQLTGPAGKDGTIGPAGPSGNNATINGVNALTIEGSEKVTATQSGSTLTIDTPNAVQVPGGGNMQIASGLGVSPYTIEFTEDEDAALSASQVSFDNAGTGMNSTDVQAAITELNINKQSESQVNNLISSALAGFSGGAQVEAGSYVGTGKYGQSNKTSYTFQSLPKIVFIFGAAGSNGSFGWIVPSLSTGFSSFFEYENYYSLTISVSGNTVSWYSTGTNPSSQFNYSGTKYSIVGIG